jgi:hypothetical protein
MEQVKKEINFNWNTKSKSSTGGVESKQNGERDRCGLY